MDWGPPTQTTAVSMGCVNNWHTSHLSSGTMTSADTLGGVFAVYHYDSGNGTLPDLRGPDGVVIDWGQYCFGWERNYSGPISAAGSQLTIVGKILNFHDPFADLDRSTTEYTFIFKELVSLGTMDTGGVVYETYYSGGAFEIYEDPPNGTSPSTFIDGTLVLEGTLAKFYVMMSLGPGRFSGTFTAGFDFAGPIGGALYDRVEGCHGAPLGNWTDNSGIARVSSGRESLRARRPRTHFRALELSIRGPISSSGPPIARMESAC